MNILNSIPVEHYNDKTYLFNYLNDHKDIGNEDPGYNGIFHVHWRGPIDNDKVILQIKSTLATQDVDKIYFWIEDNITTITSPSYVKLMQFRKYIDVRIFSPETIMLAEGDTKNKTKIGEYYVRNRGDRRYKTDIMRWIVLSIYGGVYTDLDTLLLRNLSDIRIKNWSCKWADQDFAEACILKLEKGSDVYEQMYLNWPDDPRCFLMMSNYDVPIAYSFQHDNLRFTSLPSPFFDPVWLDGKNNDKVPSLTIKNFDEFFEETSAEITIGSFMEGCFAYHWHNRWDVPELKNSVAGKLNADIDKIIEAKYSIKPIKIFQG